jgi:hypothetical protein
MIFITAPLLKPIFPEIFYTFDNQNTASLPLGFIPSPYDGEGKSNLPKQIWLRKVK